MKKYIFFLMLLGLLTSCTKDSPTPLPPPDPTEEDKTEPDPDEPSDPSDPLEIIEDVRLTISYATASSEQVGEEMKYSYDGKLNTMWHTAWGKPNAFPFVASYELSNADQLDYIVYYPRTDGANGRFGVIDVEVATTENPYFETVLANFDCKKSGSPTTINLPKSIKNPTSVRISIKSGEGGFASCSEMLFYQKAEGNSIANVVIPVYKSGYTEPAQYANRVKGGVMEMVYDQEVPMCGKVFFKFGMKGRAKIQLKVNNERIGKTLKVKLGEQEASVSIPTTIGYEWVTVFDSVHVEDTQNYSVLEIENENSGAFTIEAVRVAGTPSSGLKYLNHPENRRNSASVHLGYPTSAADIEWFYNEVTIPDGMDPYHTFYMVNGYTKGYAGIQVRDFSGAASSRIIIFSCWNSGESGAEETLARVVKYNEADVNVASFGGEGTGAKTTRDYEWETGATYAFLLGGWVEGSDTYYTLFWKEKEAAMWNYQATIKSPQNGKYLGNFYSFVENYIGSSGQYQRKANFSNQWMKRKDAAWEQLTNARFTEDGNAKYRGDIGAVVEANGYYLWNGGFIAGEGTVGATITRNATHPDIQPLSDEELQQLEEMAKL
ncbi:MAG: DUF3472 domain-containing protein [Mangrovibacterium sp.]